MPVASSIRGDVHGRGTSDSCARQRHGEPLVSWVTRSPCSSAAGDPPTSSSSPPTWACRTGTEDFLRLAQGEGSRSTPESSAPGTSRRWCDPPGEFDDNRWHKIVIHRKVRGESCSTLSPQMPRVMGALISY
ncbi:hypothetical protein AVEN_113586-1 [Araneus ventricosus]|uniref:Laminin G domain-containing protein n=1 Tax=Araneus ventricosus TaxID=182803 RepID=A0A4Y2JF29_ARAVE|nr:hypothetical protein AVEN_113586-1 [Araneus ventricosus]